MQLNKKVQSYLNGRVLTMLGLVFLAGCAGATVQPSGPEGYVEIENPGLTMSPNAPATIWVPRSYVEKGVPRGGELAKRGYQAVTGTRAPEVKEMAPHPAPQTGIVGAGGKPALTIPHFGLVAAVEGEKIYFNLGREAGIAQGQQLKVYRGGTVIEGLGLAPGECVATIEVLGFVGTKGGYGIIRQGGPVQTNDLIGAE
jgi:hypothetical protein